MSYAVSGVLDAGQTALKLYCVDIASSNTNSLSVTSACVVGGRARENLEDFLLFMPRSVTL